MTLVNSAARPARPALALGGFDLCGEALTHLEPARPAWPAQRRAGHKLVSWSVPRSVPRSVAGSPAGIMERIFHGYRRLRARAMMSDAADDRAAPCLGNAPRR